MAHRMRHRSRQIFSQEHTSLQLCLLYIASCSAASPFHAFIAFIAFMAFMGMAHSAFCMLGPSNGLGHG